MSFYLKYSPLLRIAFRENGNAGKWLEGLKISPSDKCRQLMDYYRLTAKSRSYGMEVYFEANLNYPLPDQIQNKISNEVFSFLIHDRRIPSGYKIINENLLKNFKVDNLNGGAVLPHDSKITANTSLSGSDSITLNPNDEFYKQHPFGIINITWIGVQQSRGGEFFKDYWIDLTKI